MKTSELQGVALDWAVAKANGVEVTYLDDGITRCLLRTHSGRFSPSTDWSQGGPIIEREKICLTRPRWDGQWTALLVYEDRSFDGVASVEFDAPTPLIAAMRCYVQSRLGDEVEIPEELQ